MKGLGVKDFERKQPVTPDTLFAIGSSSKAFTAMLVAMAADAGKLALDDPPRKFLPYFKLQDAESDAKHHRARPALAQLGPQPHGHRVDHRGLDARGGDPRRGAGEADGQAAREVSLPERDVHGGGRGRGAGRRLDVGEVDPRAHLQAARHEGFRADRAGDAARARLLFRLRVRRGDEGDAAPAAARLPAGGRRGRHQLERARHGRVAPADARRRRVRGQAARLRKELRRTRQAAAEDRGVGLIRPRLVPARLARPQGRRARRQHRRLQRAGRPDARPAARLRAADERDGLGAARDGDGGRLVEPRRQARGEAGDERRLDRPRRQDRDRSRQLPARRGGRQRRGRAQGRRAVDDRAGAAHVQALERGRAALQDRGAARLLRHLPPGEGQGRGDRAVPRTAARQLHFEEDEDGGRDDRARLRRLGRVRGAAQGGRRLVRFGVAAGADDRGLGQRRQGLPRRAGPAALPPVGEVEGRALLARAARRVQLQRAPRRERRRHGPRSSNSPRASSPSSARPNSSRA